MCGFKRKEGGMGWGAGGDESAEATFHRPDCCIFEVKVNYAQLCYGPKENDQLFFGEAQSVGE